MSLLLIISPQEKLLANFQNSMSRLKTFGRAAILRQYPSLAQLRSLMASRPFDAVVVGLADPAPALELISELRANYPVLPIIAANSENSSDLILGAIRAGASEYLGPPFEVEHLEKALSHEVKPEALDVPKGRLIGFLPARAGCGATTVAMHVAHAMSQEEEAARRVLLVDFDFHSGTVDFCLRLRPEFTMADALRRTDELDELWSQVACRWKKMDVLVPPEDFALKGECLDKAPAVFRSAKRTYPWVIADFPAAVFKSCQDVLTQAEAIFLVCTPDVVSMHLARRKVQDLRALGVPPEALRLVINRVGSKRSFSTAEAGKSIGIPIAYTFRNDYKAVNEALMNGRLVDEAGDLGQQFRDFARELLGLPAPAGRSVLNWRNLFSSGSDELAETAQAHSAA